MPRTSAKQQSGWTCPRCGRAFTRPTKEHSCDLTPIEWHLERTGPGVRSAFEALQVRLEALGPHRVIPLKTMESLATTRNFGGVVFGKAFLDLDLALTQPLDHPRVRQVQRLSAHCWFHRIRLMGPEDVDVELEGWLREAYECSLLD